MVDRLSDAGLMVHNGEPGAVVGEHCVLERVHTVDSTEVCLVRLAVHTFLALAGEDGNYVITRGKTFYSFAYRLHHSVSKLVRCHYQGYIRIYYSLHSNRTF